ncbi:TPA: hypothetical protein U0919_000569 [Streptococcus suis]|uniref:Uncharacterized protein n=1 Tax=Streptococcus suis TaxID=1307 RepID=M1VDN4_STRSU|nr:hypothetical protein [Streptococcus suis]HEM3177057.1 hypothetical protein [Streptococcus suis]
MEKYIRNAKNIKQTQFLKVFLIFGILGIFLYNSPLYWLFLILFFLFYLVFNLIAFFVYFKELWKTEPFTCVIVILLFSFVLIPLPFISLENDHQFSETVKSFYALAVGIGVNYVIDSVFKLVEADTIDQEQIRVKKKAAITKIFFNSLYISEYVTFLLVEQRQIFLAIFNNLRWSWLNNLLHYLVEETSSPWALIVLTMGIFVCLIGLTLFLKDTITNEIIKESERDVSARGNKMLTVEDVSQHRDTNEKLDQEIQSDLGDIAEK